MPDGYGVAAYGTSPFGGAGALAPATVAAVASVVSPTVSTSAAGYGVGAYGTSPYGGGSGGSTVTVPATTVAAVASVLSSALSGASGGGVPGDFGYAAFGAGVFGGGTFGGVVTGTLVVSVTPDVANHRVAIAVSTDLVTPTKWVLTRQWGSSLTVETVRGDHPDDGFAFVATGATRTLFDVEAVRGQMVSYFVTAFNAVTSASSTASSPVVFDSAPGNTWWVHPLPLPRLKAAFLVESQTEQSFSVSRGVFHAIGRPDPIVTFGARQTATGSLSAITYDYVEAEALRAAVEMPGVLVVRSPPGFGWGVGRRYVAFDTVTQRRLVGGAGDASYGIDLPWMDIEPPSDPVVGYGATWEDVIAGYATWNAVIAAFPTWDALMAWVP